MSLRQTASRGVKWTALANIGRRVISFGTNVVMARILAPEDFGLVAMAALVVAFMELFRDLGTGSAIVQTKELDETLLSSVFWLNAGFGFLATTVIVTAAPLVGWGAL